MKTPLESRFVCAQAIVEEAAIMALALFRGRDKLNIEAKGLQDWVSNADKSVEEQIRIALLEAFPDDSIIGEEQGNVTGTGDFTWIIDPIDGTTNFVSGIPGWCVVLACVQNEQVVCSVICDPLSDEMYTAQRGQGAYLNGRALQAHTATSLSAGTLGVGHSIRIAAKQTSTLIAHLLERQGLFRRGGSGALDLAYVAAGRLIGFVEPHMNAWDCLASLLIIEEAGGRVEAFSMSSMLSQGGRVVAAGPGVYEEVLALVELSYEPKQTAGE